ncbi:glycine cleavage system protein GcvH [Candidatus Marinamargulisbacteria bacterium SCGC AG-343-D04]|nr:glycine cleavage system protein GcvH [Candidatus Marinamargulisbacteria bacterium SCGC AG-343-D04]
MNPESCKYTEDHEWIYTENNVSTIGISKFAADELGEIVFVELPEKDSTLTNKDEFGTLESVKTVSSLYSPASGKIIDTNTSLEDDPGIVNQSPQEKGWLIKLELSDKSELDSLMSYDEYKTFLDTL